MARQGEDIAIEVGLNFGFVVVVGKAVEKGEMCILERLHRKIQN
ncbi:hypothetical protein [Phormidium tenue]